MEWNLLAFDSDFKMLLECFLHGIQWMVDTANTNGDRSSLVLMWSKRERSSLGFVEIAVDCNSLDFPGIQVIPLLGMDLVYSLQYMERATSGHAGEIESCVEETMNWRYCWRAGVMSRNEGKDREKLFV